MKEFIASGKTVDEAVENACAELGVTRDDLNVSVEIVDFPQKKLFSSIPARVKVTVDDEGFSVRDLVREGPAYESRMREEQRAREEAERAEKAEKARREAREERPGREEAPKADPKREAAPSTERREQPAAAAERHTEPEKEKMPEVEIALEDVPVGAKVALAYLRDVSDKLGAKNLTFKAVAIEDGVKFIVEGEDAAAIIGRRGEVMDALQYLSLLVSNRASEEYCKITLDVAGYRDKREKTLENLANRVAAKVKKTRYNQTLEPMNPYERRIVHSTIQRIDGVKSESVGEDPNRRVVVMLESGGKSGRDSGHGRRGGHGYSGGRGRRSDNAPREPRAESRPEMNDRATPAARPAEKQPAAEQDNKMLYGKIEL